MNIRTTVTGSKADFDRCAGRLLQAAQATEDVQLAQFLIGGATAIYTLADMEYGDNEEAFVSKVTINYNRLEESDG